LRCRTFREGHPLFYLPDLPAGGLEKALPDAVGGDCGGGDSVANAIKISIMSSCCRHLFFDPAVVPGAVPLGVIFGFFNRFSLFRLEMKEHHARSAGGPDAVQLRVMPDKSPNADNSLRCLECTKCGRGH
jgi:hypothetical protein